MTITVPWRRMTLQLSQRALTEALTFNGSSISIELAAQLAVHRWSRAAAALYLRR
jgi:hypothetical protein